MENLVLRSSFLLTSISMLPLFNSHVAKHFLLSFVNCGKEKIQNRMFSESLAVETDVVLKIQKSLILSDSNSYTEL